MKEMKRANLAFRLFFLLSLDRIGRSFEKEGGNMRGERKKRLEIKRFWRRNFQETVFSSGTATDSVTRLGDLLEFGQFFKTFGNN